MSALSDTLENALLNHVLLGGGAYTRPTSVKVGLFTASPEDDASGVAANEVSGGGYARQTVTFGAAVNGAASNSADITFTNIVGFSATPITHVAIFDQADAMLLHGALSASKTVPEGEDLVFRAGNLTVTLD